MKMALNKII